MKLTTKDFVEVIKCLEFETTAAILISLGSLIVYIAFKAFKVGFNALEFNDAVPILLSTYSVLGGIRVIIFGLENVAHSMDGTQRFYIVIGGGAVIWNGCKTIRKKYINIFT